MLYRTLGRTGLRVSLLGIGTGGPSNFGQSTGVPEADIHRLVKRALDVGVNIFDTAAGYRDSEAILGRALKGVPRDRYYLATKFNPEREEEVVKPEDVVASVERSLTRLAHRCRRGIAIPWRASAAVSSRDGAPTAHGAEVAGPRQVPLDRHH